MIGLPLGLGAAWVTYQAVHVGLVGSVPFDFPFIMPWTSIGACIVGVFIITFTIMRFSIANVNINNVVESIRGLD